MVDVRFFAADPNGVRYNTGVWCDGENQYTTNIDGTLSTWATITISDSLIESDGKIRAMAAMGSSVDEMKHAERYVVLLDPYNINNLYDQLLSRIEPMGQIEWSTDSIPCSVFLDGECIDTNSTGRLYDTTAGNHTIRFTADGYIPYEVVTNVAEGQVTHVRAVMRQTNLSVTAKSQGQYVETSVTISNNETGEIVDTLVTPFVKTLEPGTYKLIASLGSQSVTRTVSVAAGETSNVEFRFNDSTQTEGIGGEAELQTATFQVYLDGVPTAALLYLAGPTACTVNCGLSPVTAQLLPGVYTATADVGISPRPSQVIRVAEGAENVFELRLLTPTPAPTPTSEQSGAQNGTSESLNMKTLMLILGIVAAFVLLMR